jgi:hypothetical protein
MNRHTAVRPTAIGLLAAALLISGCSSKKATSGASSTASPSPSVSVAASASVTTSGAATSPSAASSIEGDPAAIKLFNEAMAGLSNAKSVHLKGTITQGGETTTLDIAFANGKGATGSLGLGGGTMKIIAVDKTVYIQADAKAFAAFAGSSVPDTALSAVAGKWIKVTSPDMPSSGKPFSGFSSFSDLKSFAKEFAPSGKVSIVPGKKTINGKTAVGLLDSGSSAGDASILYVEDGGDHLPLEVVPGPTASAGSGSAAPASGQIDFTDYNASVDVTAPTGAIDVNQLAQLFGAPGAATSS